MIKSLYKCFQHWSDEGSIFLISDTHFDSPDRELMKYDISEKEQITEIKKYVHKGDTLIHLGDVGNPQYLKQLKCYKVLIKGNHDQTQKDIPNESNWNDYFDEIYNGPLIINPKIILSHEPINITWALNIHGHDHSGNSDMYHLNLAPPKAGYKPINLKDIIKAGRVSCIEDIHRQTINEAIKRPIYKG